MKKRTKKKENPITFLLTIAQGINVFSDAQLLLLKDAIDYEMNDRKLVIISKRKEMSWLARMFKDMMYRSY